MRRFTISYRYQPRKQIMPTIELTKENFEATINACVASRA